MKFPKINQNRMKSVTVPTLSGGTNLRDALTLVADNQLTESKNMWYNDGFLKTRPNLSTNVDMTFMVGRTDDSQVIGAKKCHHDITKEIGNETAILMSIIKTYRSYLKSKCDIIFWWQSPTKTEDFGSAISFELDSLDDVPSYFVIEKDRVLYCFTSKQSIFKASYLNNPVWEEIELYSDYLYLPIVLTDCLSNGSEKPPDAIEGTAFEGYSLVTPYYKVQYTSVNQSLVDSEDDTKKHAAIYYVPANFMPKSTVKLEYINSNGEKFKHEVTLGNDTSQFVTEERAQLDNYIISVGDNRQIKLLNATDKSVVKFGHSDFVSENNIEITAATPITSVERKKLFNMTQSVWFGGAAFGINGGTRLFLTGNTEDSEKALLLWSGLNEPLYFSENNSACVGNSAYKTTGFGKQADKLVIFKENETYYTYYARNDNITAEQLINQAVVDYTASAVYFPLVLINSKIGCDCPDTVQLCRNRLVWANSNGKVYTLTSESQYTERNIFEVSGMIERALRAEDLRNATSADFEGHYVLFVKNRAFLMDYNKYGYQYVYSYSKTDDANALIPWYVWEFPSFDTDIYGYQETAFFGIGDAILFSSYYNAESGDMCSCVSASLSADNKNGADELLQIDNESNAFVKEEYVIDSVIQTKFFDFGLPAHTKTISLVNVSFGNNGGEAVKISYLTENGKLDADYIYLDESEEREYSPEYIQNRVLRPCISFAKRFGMRIECAGDMTIDAISINYKIIGGAR